MEYHNRISQTQRESLGGKYIAEGTTITDKKTGAVADIVSVVHNGFMLLPQSGLDNAPRHEFFVPFEEVVDKHGKGLIDIGGYDNSEADRNILILVIKDIMACSIIGKKTSELSDREAEVRELVEKVEADSVLDVPIEEELARGGIVGEIKASPSGVVKEVRDVEGKILKEVYVGDTLYRRNPAYKTYNSSKNDLLYRYDADKIHMAYGGIVGVEEKPNFYAVDIASPKKVQTCRVPAWATNVAESVKEGAKVTTCKAHGKWYLSSVLVPKDGITSNEAKHIGAEIRDKIEHRKMELGGAVFETGATSDDVNGLILFTDNTRNLAEYRDLIYTNLANKIKNDLPLTVGDIQDRLFNLYLKAKAQYKRETGEGLDLGKNEEREFTRIYAEEFPIWAKEKYEDFGKIRSGLSKMYGRKFEDGGSIMEMGPEWVRSRNYWEGLSKKQRLHFLLDHADYVYDKPASKLDMKVMAEYKKMALRPWSKLPKQILMAVEEHVNMGVYETGGDISGYEPKNEEQAKSLIGDDVRSTVAGIKVLIDDCDDEEEKERLKAQLREYQSN